MIFSLYSFAGVGIRGINNPHVLGRPGENNEQTQRTLDFLKNECNLTTDEEAWERLENIRCNFERAINFLKNHPFDQSDPNDINRKFSSSGLCMYILMYYWRLCFHIQEGDSYGVTSLGRSMSEGNCADDRVSINITKKVACNKLDIYSPAFYSLLSTILHEGKHTEQIPKASDIIVSDLAPMRVAKENRASAQREIEAWCLELEFHLRMHNLIILVMNTGNALENQGAFGDIINVALLNGLGTLEILRRAVALEIEKAIHAKRNYHEQSQLHTQYIDGILAEDEYRRQLKRYRSSFQENNRTIIYVANGMNQDTIWQSDGIERDFFIPPMAQITDMQLSSDEMELRVAGIDTSSNSFIYVYEDVDTDGFFDSSPIDIIELPEFNEGLDLCELPDERLLAYNYATHQLFEVDLENSSLNFAPLNVYLETDFIVDIISTDNPDKLYAFSFDFVQERNVLLSPIHSVTIISDNDGDNFYEQQTEDDILSQLRLIPILLLDNMHPIENEQIGLVDASKEAWIEIHQVNSFGNSLEVIASGQADMTGVISLKYSEPLTAGSFIQVRDISNDLYSVIYPVDETVSTTRIEPTVYFEMSPNPTSKSINISHSLNEKGEIKLFDLNGKLLFHQYFNDQNISINIAHLPLGVYFVQLSSKARWFTEQFLKQD